MGVIQKFQRMRRSKIEKEELLPSKNAVATRSLFRRKKKYSSSTPRELTIDPQITWTASDGFSDEESPVNERNTCSVVDNDVDAANTNGAPSPKAKMISEMIFNSEENKLAELQQMNKKQQEIDRMIQHEIDRMQIVLAEMMEELRVKDDMLAVTEAELDATKEEWKKVVEECANLDEELCGTKEILESTVKELNMVSVTLIQCQHQLHEKANGVFSFFNLEPKFKF
mmetsp:Transcript_11065/g.16964  ORF Transcript_11065/g.16964 Transcript_11065/m.16964 type:complete len:227 (-) Transcript_11065:102-782(-)|eukprot:CAMPEP_0194239222 /NCGR_PEP_ID=MMETSP0158-20130606/5753_1 /TAXON_ID=33649 /ORGANISM="Thalassionema nitzschioides, Strain L26-B" /LENGTH=226 /DNA_ID=CAMNT_0038973645 /DNA_START=18 /DNA_END=698 /DNA_ORIENTATION=-